ncbi:hypothetical protein Rhe02_34600 [Rhizocola hellebori]|uniref:Uncharacterized protein n=2 Tax=Rhizocola hellebori TaxID=1392758 RepID=A0A8J3Q8Y9_9ACTN|nr:hypothetical protein Rhe02_34600 [Rhizocola hellebori]
MTLVAAACEAKEPVTGTQPSAAAASASPSPTPSPSASSAAAAIHFTGEGAGPYQLGVKVAELQKDGQLSEVRSGAETCGYTTAMGIGPWSGVHIMATPDGIVRSVSTRSPSLPTAAGARVEMTLAELQAVYGSKGEVLSRTRDKAKIYLVTTGPDGHGIVFHLYPDNSHKAYEMTAASDAAAAKSGFLSEEEPIDGC